MSDGAAGFFLLFMGLVLAAFAVLQYRTGDVTGQSVFDLVGGLVPPLRRVMFWASTAFLVLLALIGLIGAGVFFMKALGYN